MVRSIVLTLWLLGCAAVSNDTPKLGKQLKLRMDGNILIVQLIKMKKDVKTFSTKKGVSVL